MQEAGLPSRDEIALVERVRIGLGELRRMNRPRSISQQGLELLLAVANHPGVSQAQLARELGVSQANVARLVQNLGAQHRTGGDGLGLIEARESPSDAAVNVLSLSQKGKSQMARFASIISDRLIIDYASTADITVTDKHGRSFLFEIKGKRRPRHGE